MVPNLNYIRENTLKYESIILRSNTMFKTKDSNFCLKTTKDQNYFISRSVENILYAGILPQTDMKNQRQPSPIFEYNGIKENAQVIYNAIILENNLPHFPSSSSSMTVHLLFSDGANNVNFLVTRNNAQIGNFSLYKGKSFIFKIKTNDNSNDFSLYLRFDYIS